MFDCISGRIICWRSLNFSNILCRTFAAEAPRKDRDLMKFSYISVFLHMLEKVGHPSKIISRYGRPLNNRLPWRSSQLSYAIWRLSRLQHFSTTIQNALYCTYSVIVKIVSLRQRCIFIFMRQMVLIYISINMRRRIGIGSNFQSALCARDRGLSIRTCGHQLHDLGRICLPNLQFLRHLIPDLWVRTVWIGGRSEPLRNTVPVSLLGRPHKTSFTCRQNAATLSTTRAGFRSPLEHTVSNPI